MSYPTFTPIMKTYGFTPEPEYKFHPTRRWKFDFCFPNHMVAVEIEGGAWTNGRHTRGKGFIGDMEKYNAATELGWKILRYTPSDLGKTATYEQIVKTLTGK
jgi:hypothetical protein